MDIHMPKQYKTVYCLKTPNHGINNNSITTVERKDGSIYIGMFTGNIKQIAYLGRKKNEAYRGIDSYEFSQQTNKSNFKTLTILRRRRRRRKRKRINWAVETLKIIFQTTNKINEKMWSIFKLNFTKQELLFKNKTNQKIYKLEKDESTVEGSANCEEEPVDNGVDNNKEENEHVILTAGNKNDDEDATSKKRHDEKLSEAERELKELNQNVDLNEVLIETQNNEKVEKEKEEEKNEETTKEEENNETVKKEKENNETINKEKANNETINKENENNEIIKKEDGKEENIYEEISKKSNKAESIKAENVNRENEKTQTFHVVSSLEELNFTVVKNDRCTQRGKIRKKKKLKHYCCRYISDDDDNVSTYCQDYENEKNDRYESTWRNDSSSRIYTKYKNMFTSNKYPELNNMNFICSLNVLNDFNNFNNLNIIKHLEDIGKSGNVDSINMGTNFNRGIFFEASSKLANSETLQNVYNKNKFLYANQMQCFALNNKKLLEINEAMSRNMHKDGVFNWWVQKDSKKNDTTYSNRLGDTPTLSEQATQNSILEKEEVEEIKASNAELQSVKYYYVSTVRRKTKKRKLRKVSLIQLCKEPYFFVSEKFLSDMESYLALNHCLMFVQKNQDKLAKMYDNFFSVVINVDDVTFLGEGVSTSILRNIIKRFKNLFNMPVDNTDEIEFCLYIKGEERKEGELKRNEEKEIHFREHSMYKYSIIIFLNTNTSNSIDFPNKGIKITFVLGNCLIYECNKINDINPFKFYILDDKIFFLKLNLKQDLQIHKLFNNSKDKKNTVAPIGFINDQSGIMNAIQNEIPKNNNKNTVSDNAMNTTRATTITNVITDMNNNDTKVDMLKEPQLGDIGNKHELQKMNADSSCVLSNHQDNSFNDTLTNHTRKGQYLVQKSVKKIDECFRLLNMGSMQKLLSNDIDQTKRIHSAMIQNYWENNKDATYNFCKKKET